MMKTINFGRMFAINRGNLSNIVNKNAQRAFSTQIKEEHFLNVN